ncbi:uncharacterized protein B0I36DRAFT_40127 [Microdochium trichocladiopsis]|uniref:DUF1772-domain-containing protein n=1 Tax=Microdochium trichocladiopsis TaxID=1682393 RepID=A0A9P9BJU8_9PEZI|nr:uncharacterized protein B0I36DRAFT_40127 [Microdochium trichocladiopsis]KAH7018513.1 hypothetical protein B0I36DRAFT_40127 [Microdochium trichocladiopsis]
MAYPPSTTSSTLASTIRALQATSILLGSTAAGVGASLSFFVMPRLLELPTHQLIQQFNRTIAISHKVTPPMLLLPGILHAVIAVLIRHSNNTHTPLSATTGRSWKLHALAALVTLTMTPWTFVFMKPLNRMMAAREKYVKETAATAATAKGSDKEGKRALEAAELGATRRGEMSSHAVVDQWALSNLYRPAAGLVTAAIGLYAAMW